MSAIQLQCGAIGQILQDVPLPAGSNLTGYTVTLLIQNGSGITNSYAMTIQGDNVTVQYTTLGTEFPVPGAYQVQIELTKSGAKVYTPTAVVIARANLA